MKEIKIGFALFPARVLGKESGGSNFLCCCSYISVALLSSVTNNVQSLLL